MNNPSLSANAHRGLPLRMQGKDILSFFVGFLLTCALFDMYDGR